MKFSDKDKAAIKNIEAIASNLKTKDRKVIASKIMTMLCDVDLVCTSLNESTRAAKSVTEPFKEKMRKDWFNALQRFDFQRDEIVSSSLSALKKNELLGKAKAELEDSWRSAIRRGYESSFRAGYASRGNMNAGGLTTRQISQISPIFDTMVKRQSEYAAQFAQQYSRGLLSNPGRMGIGARSELYFKSLSAGYNLGAVDGGRPGEKIIWNLGACDHCVDCPAIAASGPFTREKLPTVPGSGQTKCKSNCCCFLTFVKGPTITPVAQDGMLLDFTEPERSVPAGFNVPSAGDIALLRDFEMRGNFARRRVAQLDDGPEKDKWIKARSQLQGEMNDYKAVRNIHYTPRFSVGEVITSADISLKDVDEVFARGLDGITISKANTSKLAEILEQNRSQIAKAFTALNLQPATPIVPTKTSIDLSRSKADSFDKRYADFIEENESPQVMNQWTLNVMGCGIEATVSFHLDLILEMARTKSPYFVEVGPFDEDWKPIVTASGSWIRGTYKEVRRLIDATVNKSNARFVIAPYIEGV